MMYIISWFNPFSNCMTAEQGSYEYTKMYFAGIAYGDFIEWAKEARPGDFTVILNRYSVVRVS